MAKVWVKEDMVGDSRAGESVMRSGTSLLVD